MSKGLIAKAETTINKPVPEVWDALVNPEKIKQYFFNTNVVSDWQKGSKIIWKGEWEGKSYEDKGEILQIELEKVLEVTHYSPLSGAPDIPENYHTLRYELSEQSEATEVLITQDNCANENEQKHSEQNWEMMLKELKKFLEK